MRSHRFDSGREQAISAVELLYSRQKKSVRIFKSDRSLASVSAPDTPTMSRSVVS